MISSMKRRLISGIAKLLVVIFLFCYVAKEYCISTPCDDKMKLYSTACCLYEGNTGKVLYGKEQNKFMANASTTKILTCIVALENGNMNDLVTVSKYAAGMPDVQLGMKKDEKYILKDLMYSMMLESHNDSAVAIAEHIGGDVEHFSEMMNKKAKDIGCTKSFFITPNGLDKEEKIEGVLKSHGTTAKELCMIMNYCVGNKKFLEITSTMSYSFSCKTNDRRFVVNNKNAFLKMMDGMISGKTGFTGKAGYCYVGALKKDEKLLIIALLGCGWPGNKNYKWKDARNLFMYGINNFKRKKVNDYSEIPNEIVIYDAQGIEENKRIYVPIYIEKREIYTYCNEDGDGEIYRKVELSDNVNAPVHANEVVGTIKYFDKDLILGIEEIRISVNIDKYDLNYCKSKVINLFIKSLIK